MEDVPGLLPIPESVPVPEFVPVPESFPFALVRFLPERDRFLVFVLSDPVELAPFLLLSEFITPLLLGLLLFVVLSGIAVELVGEVGSVGLPAVAGGVVVGIVESPAFGRVPEVPGVPGVLGLSTGGIGDVVGAVELVEPGEVDVEGEVEVPVGGAVVVEGAVCAIATPANIAENASEHSRIDFMVELFMGCLNGGKFPLLIGWWIEVEWLAPFHRLMR